MIIESSPFQLPLNMKMVSVMFFLTRILLATFSLAGLVGSDTFTVGYLAGIILDIKEHANSKKVSNFFQKSSKKKVPVGYYLAGIILDGSCISKKSTTKFPANRGRPGREEEGYGAPGLRISGAVG